MSKKGETKKPCKKTQKKRIFYSILRFLIKIRKINKKSSTILIGQYLKPLANIVRQSNLDTVCADRMGIFLALLTCGELVVNAFS